MLPTHDPTPEQIAEAIRLCTTPPISEAQRAYLRECAKHPPRQYRNNFHLDRLVRQGFADRVDEAFASFDAEGMTRYRY